MSDTSHSDISEVEPGLPRPDVRRRRFLLAIGAGAAGAAAASPAVAGAVNAATPATTGPAPKGYRETDHIRAYYATTRI